MYVSVLNHYLGWQSTVSFEVVKREWKWLMCVSLRLHWLTGNLYVEWSVSFLHEVGLVGFWGCFLTNVCLVK